MPVRTKKLPIDQTIKVIVFGSRTKKFIISQKNSNKLINFLENIDSEKDRDELIPFDEIDAFKKLEKKYGKVGTTIRGYRARDGLTQKELALKLGIHQTHVSEIENKKRVVGKALAHKLAKVFRTNYRLFL